MASAETERELLSAHATVAEYKGVKEGRESMLRVFPQRPNKQWAEFQIIEVSESSGGIRTDERTQVTSTGAGSTLFLIIGASYRVPQGIKALRSLKD